MKQRPLRSFLARPGLATALASMVFSYSVGASAQAAPPVQPGSDLPAPEPAAASNPADADASAATPAAAPLTAEPMDAAPVAAPPQDTPAPGSAEAEPAAAEVSAADAEAAAIEAELLSSADADATEAAGELSDDEIKLNVYGFADFTYNRLLSDRAVWNNYTFGYPSFYVGNFNLYLSSNLGSNWRSLSELRFTYLPDGVDNVDPVTFAPTPRTSTAYPDYTDYNRPVEVGGVVIERVWVEYAAHPLLTARFGQWLTPYGIWNVDHGSPTIIGTTRPYIIGSEMLPQRQTGINLYGSYGIDSTQIGYNLTLSNGRGPVDAYKDFDKNKAVGWRLWAQQDTSFGSFVLGTSGYKGTFTDRTQNTTVAFGAPGEDVALGNEFVLNSEYDELSLAADLKWTWQGAVVQGEVILHDVGYMSDTRPAADDTMDGGPLGWKPDLRTWGAYGIAGYRFDFLGIMPYFGGEYSYQGRVSAVPAAVGLWGGVNVRPTARVVLKLQGTYAFYPQDWIGLETADPLKMLVSQIAWSF